MFHLCLRQHQTFPQAHMMIWLLLNISLKQLTQRKKQTKTLQKPLQVGNNCFVLTYLIKVGEQSIMLILLMFIETALWRTTTWSYKYTRSSVFTVPMHSCVFLKRYQRHWLALRGEVYDSIVSSEHGNPFKARYQTGDISSPTFQDIIISGICSIISYSGL